VLARLFGFPPHVGLEEVRNFLLRVRIPTSERPANKCLRLFVDSGLLKDRCRTIPLVEKLDNFVNVVNEIYIVSSYFKKLVDNFYRT
jgi:hypothetical protein